LAEESVVLRLRIAARKDLPPGTAGGHPRVLKVDCEGGTNEEAARSSTTALASFSAREAAMFFIWVQLT